MHRRWIATGRFAALLGMSLALPALPAHAAGSGVTSPTSAPPADYVAANAAKAAPARMLLGKLGGARRIALSTPTAADAATLKARNAALQATRGATPGKGRPLAVGYGRLVPAASQQIDLGGLDWTATEDGGKAAHIDVQSPGAAAIRLALKSSSADANVTLRFVGSATTATVFGPVPAATLADDTKSFGQYWTPVLEGDSATIEIHAPTDADFAGATLTIARISHMLIAGSGLQKISAKAASDIGLADYCEVDIACAVPQSTALTNASRAVAKMIFSDDDGYQYQCTGQLLNDTTQSFTPYFFTANHCMDSQTAARTLNTYWFFDAVSCNSLKVPAYVLLSGGATLLGRSNDNDWAIVRLNKAPPTGVRYAAWNADPVLSGSAVTILHHPEGDLKKWSVGRSDGDDFVDDTLDDGLRVYGYRNTVRYSQGSTEPGSSGAGLLTLLASAGYFEVRGGLSYGNAACGYPADTDQYTRLADALPVMRQYLTPNTATSSSGAVVVVEFFNASLNHYFISTDPTEINNLDTGVLQGWARTGLRFLAFPQAAAGLNPVCRFYERPGFGDSHFYSAQPAECTATAARFGTNWIYESPSVFYIQLPNLATGACPNGTTPVWRFLHSAVTNHRYTTEATIRDQLAHDPNWVAEGYGPGPYYPVMCAPQI